MQLLGCPIGYGYRVSFVEWDFGFDGPVWSRVMGTSKEEEVEISLKAALPVVGEGALEKEGVKLNIPGVLLDATKDMRRFIYVNHSDNNIIIVFSILVVIWK